MKKYEELVKTRRTSFCGNVRRKIFYFWIETSNVSIPKCFSIASRTKFLTVLQLSFLNKKFFFYIFWFLLLCISYTVLTVLFFFLIFWSSDLSTNRSLYSANFSKYLWDYYIYIWKSLQTISSSFAILYYLCRALQDQSKSAILIFLFTLKMINNPRFELCSSAIIFPPILLFWGISQNNNQIYWFPLFSRFEKIWTLGKSRRTLLCANAR